MAHREQWWLTRNQWWLIGSSGDSLVATPDVNLQSRVQIRQSPQPTVDCQSLDGLPSGMVLYCRLSSEGRQRRINIKKGSPGPPKTIKKKKTLSQTHSHICTWGYLSSEASSVCLLIILHSPDRQPPNKNVLKFFRKI